MLIKALLVSLICFQNRTDYNGIQYKKIWHSSDHFERMYYLFIYLFFFAALTFMHLESRTLKEVQCPASKSILSDLDTKILIQVLNLLWMD